MNENLPAIGSRLCSLDELADGTGRAFCFGAGKNAFGILVLRQGGAVTAFVNRCPHFRIPLDHATKVVTFAGHVLCSHHYAAFRFSDGYCVEGPCEGASLEPMPIAVGTEWVTVAGEPFSARDR